MTTTRKSSWSVSDWLCPVCNQVTKRSGPWCERYRQEMDVECPALIADGIRKADAVGDGPLVNGLCSYGRMLWGEGLYW